MDMPARKQHALTSDLIDQTKPASVVIDQRFGGLTNFCRLTGYPQSTVNEWRYKGYIPAARRNGEKVHTHLLALAIENGIPLDPVDFVEKPANDIEPGREIADGQ